MHKTTKLLGVGLIFGAASLGAVEQANAATIVNLGSVSLFGGPGGLDLTGNFPYAINFSNNDPNRTVSGLTFLHDRQVIPGATLVGPNEVTPWATTPSFGATADENELEQIMADIRWANNGLGQTLRADLNVLTGRQYKLQILISGNQAENRRWDISLDGLQAVDEITSLGLSGTPYSVNQSVVYTHTFTAPDNQLNIVMGNLFGINDGGDRNAIWQGLTLEDVTPTSVIPEPATVALLGLSSLGLLRRRNRATA